MFGIHSFEAFLLASVALHLVPGPDTFYVVGRSLSQGRGVGVASALGISAGTLVHTFAAAAGISAVLAASATAFTTVKLIGAAYLVFLGLKLLLSRGRAVSPNARYENAGILEAFRQGLLTNVLNPKVALFFLAFLPQFVAQDSESSFLGFLFLGLSFVTTSTLWGLFLAWSAASVSRRFRESPRCIAYLNKIMGTLLVSLGVRLAVTD